MKNQALITFVMGLINVNTHANLIDTLGYVNS
jgi:hypothetical protein